jgi:hypothetical protein
MKTGRHSNEVLIVCYFLVTISVYATLGLTLAKSIPTIRSALGMHQNQKLRVLRFGFGMVSVLVWFWFRWFGYRQWFLFWGFGFDIVLLLLLLSKLRKKTN